MIKGLIFFVILFIFSACQPDTSIYSDSNDFTPYEVNLKNSINNINTLELSDLCSEVKYVPLETNPSSLFHEIRQIAVTDSFVFISDFNSLFQFDINGRFIRKIGRQGRGPEEYIFIRDVCVNEDNNTIIIQ